MIAITARSALPEHGHHHHKVAASVP